MRQPVTARVLSFNQGQRVRRPQSTETRNDKMSRIILAAIRSEFRDVDFFTREDLLQLGPIQSVATITRYQEVCRAVHRLSNEIVELNRTELCLRDKRERSEELPPVHEQYAHQIERLVATWARGHANTPFGVMDIVNSWKMDQHLTVNSKRVAVRVMLRRMRREGKLTDTGSLTYMVNGEAANG